MKFYIGVDTWQGKIYCMYKVLKKDIDHFIHAEGVGCDDSFYRTYYKDHGHKRYVIDTNGGTDYILDALASIGLPRTDRTLRDYNLLIRYPYRQDYVYYPPYE